MISFHLGQESTLEQVSTLRQESTLGQVSPPRTSVHPSDKCPLSTVCALRTRSFIEPVWLGRASEINGFMPKGPFGQRVPYIYIVCNSSHLVVDGQSRGSQVERGLDSPEDLRGEGASTGCRSQLYSAFGITFYQKFWMQIPFVLCSWSIMRWGLKSFRGTIPGAPHIWRPILQAARHGTRPLTGSLH